MKAFLLFMGAASLLGLAGCQKDYKASCLLDVNSMTGSYKVISYMQDGVELINDPTIFEPCELDNMVVLKKQGAYEVTEGLDVCNPSKAYSGTWSVSGDTFFWDLDDYQIRDYSCNGFTLYYSYTDPQDSTLNYSEQIVLQRQ